MDRGDDPFGWAASCGQQRLHAAATYWVPDRTIDLLTLLISISRLGPMHVFRLRFRRWVVEHLENLAVGLFFGLPLAALELAIGFRFHVVRDQFPQRVGTGGIRSVFASVIQAGRSSTFGRTH